VYFVPQKKISNLLNLTSKSKKLNEYQEKNYSPFYFSIYLNFSIGCTSVSVKLLDEGFGVNMFLVLFELEIMSVFDSHIGLLDKLK